MIQQAIADGLGIESVDEVIRESQKVSEVPDDMEFEEFAKFDIIAWLADKGLLKSEKDDQEL